MQIETANDASIARAAEILRGGALVGMPTETVYGLAGDAANDKAVASIFAAKQRPRFNPLIVHVRDFAHAQSLVEFSREALALAHAFWPGPLTLVLQRRVQAPISLLASAGLDTLALRMPAHAIAQQLLHACGLALAAPSANRSGEISPTTARHVADSLGTAVDLVLDAGPARWGIESSIVGFDSRGPLLLRPGALSRDKIEAIAGKLHAAEGDIVTSPGQLRSHYAPRTPLRLNARDIRPGEALLAFGPNAPAHNGPICNLSPDGDLIEAAGHLFAYLRELDNHNCTGIAVMTVPEHGLGEAINDRLRRAATPRES